MVIPELEMTTRLADVTFDMFYSCFFYGVNPRPEDLSRYAKPRLFHVYVALPHVRKPQNQYISAFRSYLILLYSYNVLDFCSIAQFSIFSLPSDILNVISTPHLQAATLHYSTHP